MTGAATKPRRTVSRVGAGLGLTLLLALGGCGAGIEELRAWVDQERQQAKPARQSLSPPRRFDPQPYESRQAVDPFDPQKLALAMKQEVRQLSVAVARELNRRREPLEAFPLEEIRMVGSLNRGGQVLALITADKLLYQVKVGDRMGQNYGRITGISESRIELRELVQDAAGEWVERSAGLELQERTR